MKTYEQFLNERMKSMKSFNQKVIKQLKSLVPVEQLKEDSIGNTMKTFKLLGIKFGKELSISLHDETSEIYSIFMRFDDPQSAKQVVDCNQFSGKWNIHERTEEDAINEFIDRINLVMGNEQ